MLVCGGRDFSDAELLRDCLNELLERYPITTVVHGAARGADSLAGEWAEDCGLLVEEYPADWNKYGKAAGPIRNQQMLESLTPGEDIVVAFPGGRGTQDMIDRSRKAGVYVVEIK